ncbi:magnesium/cobalt transporter CorA [Uliginosibacterium sp. H1]|uniref:magnesium/cobalt transporter CorA n=1 Tax=Uliginosibacterium sp. H1 TaxID=3114757 RepID=UPI002E195840|nr:magnesium/cobalt transporter CorA [Uliginosibacterium sp. H1]
MSKINITLFDYDEKELEEVSFESIEGSRGYHRQHRMLWLNVHGLHDTQVMQEIGRRFNLHPLVMEDIANTEQRPKVDDYGDYLYIVLRAFKYDDANSDALSHQISLVLGRDFVLSFQEEPTGLFEPIRQRLRKDNCVLRRLGSDALVHNLIDAVVDPYFVVVEAIADDVEQLEDLLITDAPVNPLERINHFKRETLELRRAAWPTREVLNSLLRHTGGFFTAETQLYLRDVYDHSVHVIEHLDSLRDLIGDLLDIHLSAVSNRLNLEVRLLTVVTMLFAPATLVTGFFGMNFEYLPLLKHSNGWIEALAIMFALAVGMGLVFWRKRWLDAKRA